MCNPDGERHCLTVLRLSCRRMDEDDYVDCSNQMRGWRRLDEGSNQFGRLPIVFYMEAINSRREPRLIPPHALFYNHFFIYFWTVPGLGPPKTPLMHA